LPSIIIFGSNRTFTVSAISVALFIDEALRGAPGRGDAHRKQVTLWKALPESSRLATSNMREPVRNARLGAPAASRHSPAGRFWRGAWGTARMQSRWSDVPASVMMSAPQVPVAKTVTLSPNGTVLTKYLLQRKVRLGQRQSRQDRQGVD